MVPPPAPRHSEARGGPRETLVRRLLNKPQHGKRAYLRDLAVYVPPAEDFITKAELKAAIKDSVSERIGRVGGEEGFLLEGERQAGGRFFFHPTETKNSPFSSSSPPTHPQGIFKPESCEFMSKVLDNAGLAEKVREMGKERGREGFRFLFSLSHPTHPT